VLNSNIAEPQVMDALYWVLVRFEPRGPTRYFEFEVNSYNRQRYRLKVLRFEYPLLWRFSVRANLMHLSGIRRDEEVGV